jgi:hypothetical protein
MFDKGCAFRVQGIKAFREKPEPRGFIETPATRVCFTALPRSSTALSAAPRSPSTCSLKPLTASRQVREHPYRACQNVAGAPGSSIDPWSPSNAANAKTGSFRLPGNQLLFLNIFAIRKILFNFVN